MAPMQTGGFQKGPAAAFSAGGGWIAENRPPSRHGTPWHREVALTSGAEITSVDEEVFTRPVACSGSASLLSIQAFW